MAESLAGRLLISAPVLEDPNFGGTILLLIEHGDEGALGLILNRPSDLTIADAFPEWSEMAAAPGVVFSGGPVERNAMVVLATGTPVDEQPDSDPLPMGLRTVDLDEQPALARGEGIEEIRVYAGYAGWGSGQLDGEIAAGAWWLVEGTVEDVFSSDPSNLWTKILRRQKGELAWFAHLPEDPSLN